MPLVEPWSNGDTRPDCTLIIPVFNGLEYTRRCLEALFADNGNTTFEIIAVDNGSSDGVEVYLASLQDKLTLLMPGENLGFARANNLAAQQARGRYLVLLNNDTIPEPGWLDAMTATVESDLAVTVVGAKLLYPDCRLVQHAGVAFNRKGKVFHIYEYFPEDHPAVNRRREFQAVTAACMLIQADRYHKLGGLDERFINGFEDVDFCLRVRENGWRVVYEPRAVVLHHAGVTPGRHDRENHNAKLLTRLWKGKIEPDNERYFAEDGYRMETLDDSTDLIYPREGDIKGRLEQARAALKEGRLAEALELYEAIYRLMPQSLNVIHYIAQIYERRGEYDKAQDMLTRSARILPNPDVLVRLAALALKRKRFDEATGYACRALESEPLPPDIKAEALAVSGDAAFKTGDLDLALERYNAALAVRSDSERALVGVGTVHLTRKEYSEALQAFGTVGDANRHLARAHLGKGLALMGLGDHAAAADSIMESLLLDPDNSWALATLLPLLTETGRLQDAYRQLDRHLKRYPDDNPMLLAQAGVAFAMGQHDSGRILLEHVKAVAPDLPGLDELEQGLRQFSVPVEHHREPAVA